MIRTTRLEHLMEQATTSFNVDLMPTSPAKSMTIQGPVLLPEDIMNMNKMNKFAPAPPKLNYVTIQNNPNTMAAEYINQDKITNSSAMLYDAMKPVGKGATIFTPSFTRFA